MTEDDVWFEPKRYGYGAGMPVAWQGWALLAAYIAVMMLGTVLLPERWGLYLVLTTVATIALLVIAAAHTRGGWRWRSGKDYD